ncbi:MAG: glycosyltransferase [Myxococcales bacterium]|nr:MAG: glycosyltransferase [Myxococcales bacterium]
MKRPSILYITYGNMFRTTGFAEQVRAEVAELARRGYPLTLLAFENYTEFSRQASGRLALDDLCRSAGARLVPVPTFAETRDSFRPLRRMLDGAAMMLAALARRADILHAHHLTAIRLALSVGRLLRRPVVADLHGVQAAEYLYGGASESDPAYRRFVDDERRAVLDADLTFVVSEAFKRYVIDEYGAAEDKILVTPSCADTNEFRIDENARAGIRAEIGVGDRPVIAFVGSAQGYHVFDEVLRFVQAAREIRPDVFALVLTTDPEAVRSALSEADLGDSSAVRRVPHAEVPRWLNAADLGLLLREPSLVNAVASPVKAAEYLACGLPLAISEGVGDLSALVRQEKLGVVVETLDGKAYAGAARRFFAGWEGSDREALRARCRRAAVRRLSWESCMKTFDAAYRRLRPECFVEN